MRCVTTFALFLTLVSSTFAGDAEVRSALAIAVVRQSTPAENPPSSEALVQAPVCVGGNCAAGTQLFTGSCSTGSCGTVQYTTTTHGHYRGYTHGVYHERRGLRLFRPRTWSFGRVRGGCGSGGCR